MQKNEKCKFATTVKKIYDRYKKGFVFEDYRMNKIIENGIKEIFTLIYTSLGFSLCLAILFMFAYLYVKEKGLKDTVKMWIGQFRQNRQFRGTFFLALYCAMVAFRTLLNRNLWMNPLSNVMGGWWIYNSKGEFTAEAFLNLVMLMPLTFLIFFYHGEQIFPEKKLFKILLLSVKISFFTSISIEFLQLMMRLGTVQISDIVYNTLGGVVGGIIYFILKGRRS